MKLTCVMVMTADGLVTRGDKSPMTWSSQEDKEHFRSLIKNFDVLITGRKTFSQLTYEKEYFVLTHNKDLLEKKEGHVQYVNSDAKEIYEMICARGYKNAGLIGGPETNYVFFKEHLVDDLYITIEPYLFGKGNHFSIDKETDCMMTLESVTKLNDNGTVLLHYIFNR